MNDYRKGYHFRNWSIPEHTLQSIERYVEHGCPVGSFLEAVICNDFKAACMRADDQNAVNLMAYAAYFYNEAPIGCYGTKQRYKAWIAQGGRTQRHINPPEETEDEA